MRYHSLAGICAVWALVVLSASPAPGQNPLARFSLFKHVEADPNATYPLTKQNGPWMIMAASFSAPMGRTPQETAKLRQECNGQANALVYELRKRFKLEAYVFQRQNARGRHVTGRGVDSMGRPLRLRYRRRPPGEEVAVLVGNYPEPDDAAAQRDLRKIKQIGPDALSLVELQKQDKRTFQQLCGWRLMQKNVTPSDFARNNPSQFWQSGQNVQIDNDTRRSGPMGSAMLTRNPLLPKPDRNTPVIDRFVYDMNKDVRYSLMDCPGKYTVKVATFTGAVIVDQKKIDLVAKGRGKLKSRLADAAAKAHEMTVALRLKNYEAYEFHDRCASIVTVGSFYELGARRGDGRIQLNPLIERTIQAFSPSALDGGKPKTIVGVPFDMQPVPALAPKRSISTDYADGGIIGLR